MKMKIDFVTNSSSTGYIVAVKPGEVEDFEDYIRRLNNYPEASNEGVRCYFISGSLKELQESTNGGPLDWISKACGPKFEQRGKPQYERCKKIIDKGKVAAEVWVDYNVCDIFEDHFEDLNNLSSFI